MPALDTAEIGAVHAAAQRKLLLRDPASCAQIPDGLPEREVCLRALGHNAPNPCRVTPLGLQPMSWQLMSPIAVRRHGGAVESRDHEHMFA
jgi:hypothetical protein